MKNHVVSERIGLERDDVFTISFFFHHERIPTDPKSGCSTAWNKPRPLPTFPLAFQILSSCSMVRDSLPPTLPYLCRWKVSLYVLDNLAIDNIYIYYTNILIRGIKQWSKYPTTEETNGKKNEGLESRK